MFPFSDDKLKCQNCGTLYDVQSAEKHTKQMRELFDEAKQELINNLRRNLYNAVNAEYISSTEVQGICTSLKQYLPDDFQANFYEIATGTNVRRIAQAIREIDVDENYDDLDGVICYLIRSLQGEYLLELNNLVERAYKMRDLQKFEQFCTYISEEAEKVQMGVYETKIPREVFVAYSSKDMDKVSDLVSVLEAQGLKCFVAARNLRHGKGAVENYNRALEEAMDHCRSFVFVSSRNSRNINCDALEIEIPYVEGKDIENAPAQYRNNYQSIPTHFKKPRVEYRIEESRGFNAADSITNKFFDGYERVYSPEEVAKRVIAQLVTTGSEPAESAQKKYCDACGHENLADAKFCIECGNRSFVESIAEFIRLSKQKEEQIQRDAARRVEAAQKAAETAAKNAAKTAAKNAAKSSASRLEPPPPKKKKRLSCGGCLLTFIIVDVIGALVIGGVIFGLVPSFIKQKTNVQQTAQLDWEEAETQTPNEETTDDWYEESEYTTEDESKEDFGSADSTGALVYSNVTGGLSVSVDVEMRDRLSGELVIPASVDGVAVVEISDNAFAECTKITSVTVPDSVGRIGRGAFGGCYSLRSMTLPFVGESASSTGYEATLGYIFGSNYSGNTVDVWCMDWVAYIPQKLSEITLVGVENIEDSAFRNCSMIKKLNLGDSLVGIGEEAFLGCTSLEEISLADGVTSIPTGAFEGCTALKRVRFNTDLVTEIGARAFWGCTSLLAFNDDAEGDFLVSDQVTSIGESAFSGCIRMSHLSVPFVGESESAVGKNSLFGFVFGSDSFSGSVCFGQYYDSGYSYSDFYVPAALKTVTVTKDSSIGEYAFQNCTFLTSIELSESVTFVGSYAFAGCTALTAVSLPNVSTLSSKLFENCTSLASFEIGDGVTEIASFAFKGCSALASVTGMGGPHAEGTFIIPDTVKTIGEGAFGGCSQMQTLKIPFVGQSASAKGASASFGYIFGTDYYSEGVQTIQYNNIYDAVHFYIPQYLTEVTLTVATQIPAYAFQNCVNLVTVNVPDTIKSVGKFAFEACTSLESLVLPSVTVISEGVMRGCTSLETVSFSPEATEIGSEAFRNCAYLTRLNSDTVGEFIVPSTVKKIGKAAFSGCVQMTSLTIPFVGYTAVSEVPDGFFGFIFGEYSESGTEIIHWYNNNYDVLRAYVPSSLAVVTVTNASKLVEHAFQNCTMIEEIYINTSAETGVHATAFEDCHADVYYRDFNG